MGNGNGLLAGARTTPPGGGLDLAQFFRARGLGAEVRSEYPDWLSHVGNATRDIYTPPAPDDHADGDFSHEGPVWVVSLNNDQTRQLQGVLAIGGGSLAGLSGPLWPFVAAALAASVGYIEATNRLGGNHGVDINGVIGTLGVIVTPRGGGLYGEAIKAARIAVSGRTIMDFLVMASQKVPSLAQALHSSVAASILSAAASGTPLGWAIAGGVGILVKLFEPEPDPNAHGAVVADRGEALEWESFTMTQLGVGNTVSLHSWLGYFSAQMGGGAGVYANRPQCNVWETWTRIENGDGTISLQSIGGHFLCAEEGGGRECNVTRTQIGDWEKFHLINLPGGKVALRSLVKGRFVSVQKDS